MKKRMIATILTAIIAVMSVFMFFGCAEKATDYTDGEHLARVASFAHRRYIENGTYSNLKAHSLYNENDKLGYFLIELEPYGYEYVKLNDKASPYGAWGLYTRAMCAGYPWARTIPKSGSIAFYEFDDGRFYNLTETEWSELDENGDPIFYKHSHFSVANIKDEKRYLLKVRQANENYYIPAVKRGDKYLNLISLKEFDYKSKTDKYEFSVSTISFNPVSVYDL